MLSNRRCVLLSIILMFTSICCFSKVGWNEYHDEIIYFNYDGQHIVLKDLPSLPSVKLDRVDVRDIQPSSLIPAGLSSSFTLDSLLRVSLMERSLFALCHDEYAHDFLRFMVFNQRVEINNNIDSYLVYTLGFTLSPTLFLVNVQNGRVQSIMMISGRVSIEKKDALTAVVRGGSICLFENGYRSLLNSSWRYVSKKSRHLTDFQMDGKGLLSVVKNYCLFIPREAFSFSKQDKTYSDVIRRKWQSDTLEYANYDNESIMLSELPKCGIAHSHSFDLKKVFTTPMSSFTQEETALLGPALCQENWTENAFYWLTQVQCRKGLKSYLVLVNAISDGYGRPRIFLINCKGHHLTSVVNASFIGGPYECYRYVHSYYHKGSITVFKEYGEKAVSPVKVVRDYYGENNRVYVYNDPYDLKEDEDVLHEFNLYESQMPKSSKYELFLDENGYLVRK